MALMLLTVALTLAAEPWHPRANLEVFTAVPTDVGLRGTLEGPGRVRLTGSAGLLPRPYLDAINDVAMANAWYDEKTASLIDAALQDALVLRLHLGWRPFPEQGFQFELGYGWIGLGGGLTGADIIEVTTGYDLAAFLGDSYPFAATASLHRVEASFGWEHVFGGHFLFRWDLGASYTLSAEADVVHDFDSPALFDPFFADVEAKANDELEIVLEKYVHTPILSVGVGWRFQ